MDSRADLAILVVALLATAILFSKRVRTSRSWQALAALTLNWVAEIFDIIAFASRAFALYYLLQCAAAFTVASSLRRRLAFSALAALLLLVALFAVPVG